MIGRRAAVGLSLLCALMFSALAAQSAMAQKGEKAINTTAVTCVDVGLNKGEFEDAHCDKTVGPEKGKYEHVPISNDTTTEIEITNETTSGATEKAKLNSTLGGIKTEIICTKAASVKEKTFIHNVLVEKKHTVTGTVLVNFTGCEVKGPAKCKVKEPIVTTATFEGVEKLNPAPTGKEMGVEFKGEGEKGAFAELIFEGEGCALLSGNPFLVQGSAIATGNTATQSEKYSGATSKYETGPESNTMETLTIGQPAQFTGVFTTRMAVKENPIALTTVT